MGLHRPVAGGKEEGLHYAVAEKKEEQTNSMALASRNRQKSFCRRLRQPHIRVFWLICDNFVFNKKIMACFRTI